jgi:hypothetical protein
MPGGSDGQVWFDTVSQEVPMTLTEQMLDTTPAEIGYDRAALVECIAACFECAQVCSACADACLAEEMVDQLRRCITSDLNCADLCATTGRILSRQTGYDPDLSTAALQACRDACERCATECESHAEMHEHCRLCAEACRRCAQACAALLAG